MMRRLVSTSSILMMAVITLVAVATEAQKVGGNFSRQILNDPTTLHPITASDFYSRTIHDYTLASLMSLNENTWELEPMIAEKMEVSRNGLEFTFTLREGVKFHDGKPVTAEDVKFSFDAIFMPEFKAAHLIPYYSNISKVEILNPKTVKITTKEKYHLSQEFIGGWYVLPKHVYGDPKARMNKTVVGAGPYKFKTWDRGKRIVLERDKDWWGFALPQNKNRFNFATLTFRIIKNESVAFEMLKKGEIDFMELTPEQYVLKAKGPDWGKKLIKEQVENKAPKGYGYIGWNLRRPLLQDRETRRALGMLINRPLMNEKFRFNMSLLQTGPVYVTSEYANPNVKPLEFDPKKALELLKSKGWDDKDKNGVLERSFGGKTEEFRFTLMTANEDSMKYMTMIKEEAKKIGVDIDIRVLEWSTFMKLIDEEKFDAVALSWGSGTVNVDPKQLWHSSSAVKGGSNFVGYKNPEVDKLIDQARAEMDKKKRLPILHKFYEIVAHDAPYAWLFSPKYIFYAHTAKVGKPQATLGYGIGVDTWWMQ